MDPVEPAVALPEVTQNVPDAERGRATCEAPGLALVQRQTL